MRLTLIAAHMTLDVLLDTVLEMISFVYAMLSIKLCICIYTYRYTNTHVYDLSSATNITSISPNLDVQGLNGRQLIMEQLFTGFSLYLEMDFSNLGSVKQARLDMSSLLLAKTRTNEVGQVQAGTPTISTSQSWMKVHRYTVPLLT